MEGGFTYPSDQKPIPSPRAKNQEPSKKIRPERGGGNDFFENLVFNFYGFISEEMALMLLKNPCFSFSCFHTGSRPTFETPWRSKVAPLESSHEEEVLYPADEEDNGLVAVTWRGHPIQNLRMYYALNCMLEYLTESSVSPLKKAFVECDDPLCSS